MQQYETKTFPRVAKSDLGPGESTLYFTDHGETLGYVDFNEERTQAAVTVCDPYRGTSRHYDYRDIEKAQAILDRHVKKQGYEAPEEVIVVEHDHDDEIVEEKAEAIVELAEAHQLPRPYTETGLKKLLDDIDSLNFPHDPLLCPRCGINKLDASNVLNARSRHAPVTICTPCGVHESFSSGGLDLWFDQMTLRDALRAQDEKRARQTLCELTPAQSSAVRSAVVWP